MLWYAGRREAVVLLGRYRKGIGFVTQEPDVRKVSKKKDGVSAAVARLRGRFGRIAGRVTRLAVFSAALLMMAVTLADTMVTAMSYGEAGFPDSYILHDARRYAATGVLYKDLSEPPYNATLYGPPLYWLLARTVDWGENPFTGPRIALFAGWSACIALVGYLTSLWVRVRHAGLLGMMLAAGIPAVAPWILQLRPDFFGTLFGLLAIVLLHRGGRAGILLAGCCAGVTVTFKVTMVAALAAGALWLLLRRDFRGLAHFACGAILALGAVLGGFLMSEPRMPGQMAALRQIIPEFRGALGALQTASAQPVALLGLAAFPFVLRKGSGRRALLPLYAGLSWAAAAVTVVQAGGNVNYFIEGLWAMVPLATTAVLLSLRVLRRFPVVDLGLGLAIAVFFLGGAARSAGRIPGRLAEISDYNRELRCMQSLVKGASVMTTIPRLALMTPEPAITEPYMVSYQLKNDGRRYSRLRARLRQGEFDLVVTDIADREYRGIPFLAAPIRAAMAEGGYAAFCGNSFALVYMRNGDPEGGGMAQSLTASGCRPMRSAGEGAELWPGRSGSGVESGWQIARIRSEDPPAGE